MTLMLPTPNMGVSQHNLAATPGTIGLGTAITANSSANTKATSWTTLIASTNFDVSMIVVVISNNSLAGSVRNWLIDIGVGASSSEQALIANISTTASSNQLNSPTPAQYHCPIYVPKGTRISARGQCSTGSATGNVLVWLFGGPSQPGKLFAGAESIGTATGTSKGTAITAGSTGTESAWTSLGGTTSREYRAILPMVGTDTNAAMTNFAYHMEWGYSSTTLGERYFLAANTECVGGLMPSIIDYTTIPSGTQLQARAECSGTGEALQYSLLGFF